MNFDFFSVEGGRGMRTRWANMKQNEKLSCNVLQINFFSLSQLKHHLFIIYADESALGHAIPAVFYCKYCTLKLVGEKRTIACQKAREKPIDKHLKGSSCSS